MKAVKLLIKKTTVNGMLDCDESYKGLLELRNTPRTADGRSPAEILFSKPMRSNVPIHHSAFARAWLEADEIAIARGLAYRRQMKYQYDKSSWPLTKLKIGQEVLIQNPDTRVWDTPGRVVAVGRTGRDYRIKNDANKSWWRKRRFLRRLYRPMRSDSDDDRQSPNDDKNDTGPRSILQPPLSDQNSTNLNPNHNTDGSDQPLRRSRRAPKPVERLDL